MSAGEAVEAALTASTVEAGEAVEAVVAVADLRPLRSIYQGTRFRNETEAAAWVMLVGALAPRVDDPQAAMRLADDFLREYMVRRSHLDAKKEGT
jgi:hypothetical protein